MAQTQIQWTQRIRPDGTVMPGFTFNPWSGCTKVSDGCKNCYAEVNYSVKIRGVQWGPQGNRIVKADSGWNEPVRWNTAAANLGEIHNVFCASLADVFEGQNTMPAASWDSVEAARVRLFELIYATPNLNWQLVTKRPENIMETVRRLARKAAMDPNDKVLGLLTWFRNWLIGQPPKNVWLLTSVEDQDAANKRIGHLLKCPAVVHGISLEPMLGPVDLKRVVFAHPNGAIETTSVLEGDDGFALNAPRNHLRWVIVGGESGPKSRPCNIGWMRDVVKDCKEAGTSVFVKQLGARPYTMKRGSKRQYSYAELLAAARGEAK